MGIAEIVVMVHIWGHVALMNVIFSRAGPAGALGAL